MVGGWDGRFSCFRARARRLGSVGPPHPTSLSPSLTWSTSLVPITRDTALATAVTLPRPPRGGGGPAGPASPVTSAGSDLSPRKKASSSDGVHCSRLRASLEAEDGVAAGCVCPGAGREKRGAHLFQRSCRAMVAPPPPAPSPCSPRSHPPSLGSSVSLHHAPPGARCPLRLAPHTQSLTCWRLPSGALAGGRHGLGGGGGTHSPRVGVGRPGRPLPGAVK